MQNRQLASQKHLMTQLHLNPVLSFAFENLHTCMHTGFHFEYVVLCSANNMFMGYHFTFMVSWMLLVLQSEST